MARNKEQAAIYMRNYRRTKRLEKAGVSTDPHAACDRLLTEVNKTLEASQAEVRRLVKESADLQKLVKELMDQRTIEDPDPLAGLFES